MRLTRASFTWWGPPRKFESEIVERRVSWLELFYDLVYVIAIARITHHLSMHITLGGVLEYICFFVIVFWGWLNGSLYHDIHGNEGLRTRLMTLWQMMIIAAFAITLDASEGRGYGDITIILMIMQVFITYLWWAVGFYDPSHRRYNKPYTILFLIALAAMGMSLILQEAWLNLLVPLILVCNYAPPFIAQVLLRRSSLDLHLSTSMFERLGLFTIIVFGEVVLGVINAVGALATLDFVAWLDFALALSIVFSLWWIFFTLVSNREAKKGFMNATLFQILFLPTLIALGLIAVSFTSIFDTHSAHGINKLFGFGIAIFLFGISLMMGLLELPEKLRAIKRPIRISLAITSLFFFATSFMDVQMASPQYLVTVVIVLLVEITYINATYYRFIAKLSGEGEAAEP